MREVPSPRSPQVLEAHALPLRVEAVLATPEGALVPALEAVQPVPEPPDEAQEVLALHQERQAAQRALEARNQPAGAITTSKLMTSTATKLT